MIGLVDLLLAWRWPLACLVGLALVCRTLVILNRQGVRVEIVTRRPIQVSTGGSPFQAQVTRVRL